MVNDFLTAEQARRDREAKLFKQAQEEIKRMKASGEIIVKASRAGNVEYFIVDNTHQAVATCTPEFGEMLYKLSYIEGIRKR